MARPCRSSHGRAGSCLQLQVGGIPRQELPGLRMVMGKTACGCLKTQLLLTATAVPRGSIPERVLPSWYLWALQTPTLRLSGRFVYRLMYSSLKAWFLCPEWKKKCLGYALSLGVFRSPPRQRERQRHENDWSLPPMVIYSAVYDMGLLGFRSPQLFCTVYFRPHSNSRKGLGCLDITMFTEDPKAQKGGSYDHPKWK